MYTSFRKNLTRCLTAIAVGIGLYAAPTVAAQTKVLRGEAPAAAQARWSHLYKSRDTGKRLYTPHVPHIELNTTSQAHKAAPARVTIAGYVPGNNKLAYGMYSIDAVSDPSMTLLYQDPMQRMVPNGGGTQYADRYYYVEWHYGIMGDEIFPHYGIVDTDSWTELYRSAMDLNPIDETSIAMDLTYCPADNRIYGIFEDYDVIFETYKYWFGYLDQYGDRVGIVELDRPFWAIASDSKGTIYAIDDNGALTRIDRTTGALSVVGRTGIKPKYLQSAAFDFRTDRMYWSANGDDILSAIYTVDTATGAVSKVCSIPDDEMYFGIYIVEHNYADEAPFKPTDLTADFSRGSLSGTVSFRLPSTTYAGTALTGTMDYTVTLGGTPAATGNGAPGATVTVAVTAPAAAMYDIEVVASNAAGESPAVKTSLWIGDDMPGAPTKVTAVKNATNVTVTWSTPEDCLHGGYLNPLTLKYNVVRWPDRTTLATGLTDCTYTDRDMQVPIKEYWYEIQATADGKVGGSGMSGNVFLGAYYEVPFTENFAKADSWALFTTADVNDDGKEWLYYDNSDVFGEAGCAAPSTRDRGDDWLMTAPIYLDADWQYVLTFDARSTSNSYAEEFEIALGDAANPDAMGRILIPRTEVKSSIYKPFTVTFSVPEDGLYHLGFHAVSPKYRNWLFIDNISLDRGQELGAPAAVTDLTVTPAPLGGLKATISFTAPTRTVGEEKINVPMTATIYRGANEIGTVEGIAAGAPVTYDDTNPENGENDYIVVCSTPAGTSEPVMASAWVGIDIPSAPTDVKATTAADGSVVVTWQAPTTGEHGGYIDPRAVVYYVANSASEQPLAGPLSTFTYTDTKPGAIHRHLVYLVAALNQIDVSEWGISNLVVVGQPHTLPYAESFADAQITAGPWAATVDSGDGEWQITASAGWNMGPQDKDGGLIAFYPEGFDDQQATLYSGKFDISKTAKPAMSFYYYDNMNGAIDLKISADGGEYTTEQTIALSDWKQWRPVQIDLSKYLGSKYISVAFVALSQNNKKVMLDNIRLFDDIAHDLTVADLVVPARMHLAKHAIVRVTAKNIGQEASGAFTVELLRNDTVVQTKAVADILEPDQTYTASFEELPDESFGTEVRYQAHIVYADDQNQANNTSDEVTVKVKQPVLPPVTNLTMNVEDGKVNLAWSAPSLDDSTADAIVDDFEEYRAFTTTDFGEYLNIDGDGAETVGIQFANFPNPYAPKGWMVFNPVAAGLSVAYDDGTPNYLAPASGDQYLIALCSHDYDLDMDVPNDDWLISPLLTGKAQTISFDVKRLGMNYEENFQVLVSSTGDSRADFTAIYDGNGKAPFEQWATISVAIPAGTKYFAIRCISNGAFALMLDNLTYTPASEAPADIELLGYNVYRDDQRVNESIVEAPTFVHALGTAPEYFYHVTAVYDRGESAPSERLSTRASGLESIATDGAVTIAGTRGAILISGADGAVASVHTIDGRELYRGTASRIPAAAGIYMVQVADTVAKVIVR